MNHTWEPIVFIRLTTFQSGHELDLNIQSIESIQSVPEQPEVRSPAFTFADGKSHPEMTRPGVPAHTIIIGKTGEFYYVNETRTQIDKLVSDQMKKVGDE